MTGGNSASLTVLHIDTERGWRGGERQALWLATGLERIGHRSLVAARPGDPLAIRAAENGLTVIPCAPVSEADALAAFMLRRIVIREGVQIVHAHTAHAVALASLTILLTPARMVLTRRVDFPLRRNIGTLWKYGRAHAIIAISRAVADVLVKSGIQRSRIEVVPSGVDLNRAIQPSSRDELAALGIPGDAPFVILVAALVPHKDPVTFVRAIAAARRKIPSLHGLIVGDGPLRSAVESAVTDNGLENAVHFAGFREDADALLAAADIVALSSREEGLGTVLMDALVLGRPVAATAAGGIPEIICNGSCGLLAPVGGAEALGEAFVRILRDPALTAQLIAGGREQARQFSIERTAERTAAVYERVLAAPARLA